MTIETFVGDWGGFEKLVATLHETGEVAVERDVSLPGRSGASRQIDVLIRHRQGLYEHLVVVECKHWRRRITRLHVDALTTTVQEVGAAKGVIFSSKGFQAGAITQARQSNIDLFVLRDLERHEWGNPGRVVDLFLQVAEIGFKAVTAQASFIPTNPGGVADPEDVRFAFSFGDSKALSATPLLRANGTVGEQTLEQCILDGAKDGAKLGLNRAPLFNGGAQGTYYLGLPMTLNAQIPFLVPRASGLIRIPALSIDAVLRINQSRITVDRGEDLEFAFAVESKITGEVSLASREFGAALTTLASAPSPSDASDDSVRNGQVIRVLLSSLFDAAEMAGMQPASLDEWQQPFQYVDPNDQP